MTNVATSQLVPLTIPTGGMSTRYPLAKMPVEYSPWIRDYDNEGVYYEARKGAKWLFNAVVNYVSAIAPHPTNKNRVLQLDTYLGQNRLGYYDVISGSSAFIASVPGPATSPRALTTSFNKNAYFFLNGSAPLRYDGTTFQTTGYTGPTMANVVFGFSYKSRMYLVTNLSTSVWYGGIAFVTGATKEVDFASLTQDAGIIVCGFSFTLSSGLNSESLFALVFDTGEMLVFSGNYPDDVTNWTIVARARIGAPLGYQSIIEQNGDVLVLTKTGIVSCRTLLTTAQGDVQAASITSEIEKYWTQLTSEIQKNDVITSWSPSASLLSFINGSFHQQRNKIVIFVPKYLSPHNLASNLAGYVYENAPAVLVYDIPTRSWTVQVPRLIGNTSQFISSYYWATFGKLLFGTNDISVESAWEYWGREDSRDEIAPGFYNEYFPELKTAFVSSSYQSLVKGVFVTHQGEFSKGATSLRLVSDSGANVTEGQNVQPDNGSAVSRDYYTVGIKGENIQVSLVTSTAPDGSMQGKPYRLIGLTAQIEPTRSPR